MTVDPLPINDIVFVSVVGTYLVVDHIGCAGIRCPHHSARTGGVPATRGALTAYLLQVFFLRPTIIQELYGPGSLSECTVAAHCITAMRVSTQYSSSM